jgi:hypothetical protein
MECLRGFAACVGPAHRKLISTENILLRGLQNHALADPDESWRHDDDSSAPAVPVTSLPEEEDTAQGAATSVLPPPPPLPLLRLPQSPSAADLPEGTQAWPPHGSPQWRSSFQTQRPAAAGSRGSSALDDRSAAATAGEPVAPDPASAAGADAPPRAAGDGISASPAASNGAASSGPATPRKQAAADGRSEVAAPTAAVVALHPLWLTFADPALERAFVAWHARQTQLVRNAMPLWMCLCCVACCAEEPQQPPVRCVSCAVLSSNWQ